MENDNKVIRSTTYYHPLSDDIKVKHLDNINDILLTRNDIRVLSYNIFLRPPPIKTNEDDYKNERLDDFIKELDNYDIICLQEMFSTLSYRKTKLVKAAIHAGFFYYVETESPNYFSTRLIDGGLIILSRFPIESYSFAPFTDGILCDQLCEKGILYANIRVKNTNLHLFNTHLQASYSQENDLVESMHTRIKQLEEGVQIIKEVLDSQYKPGEKVILCGDFNVNCLSVRVLIKYRQMES
jgi:endonuclease/exonuclease/phosphatase family metal-dependent hydrolase